MVWRFNGNYAPVLYKYYGDAKVWNNPLEQSRGKSLPSAHHAYRTLKPRHLCFLRVPEVAECRGVDVLSVQDWETREAGAGRTPSLRYLFVAYSTEHFSHASLSDLQALHMIAETAARQAGIPAYWVACSCMRNENELESDVSSSPPEKNKPVPPPRMFSALTVCVGIPDCRCFARSRSHDHCPRRRGRSITEPNQD